MEIVYNKAAIIESADHVVRNAAGMIDDFTDVQQRTGALLNVFSGDNSFNFADHQTQFLDGFHGLIETVMRFGSVVHTVLESAIANDVLLSQSVPGRG